MRKYELPNGRKWISEKLGQKSEGTKKRRSGLKTERVRSGTSCLVHAKSFH